MSLLRDGCSAVYGAVGEALLETIIFNPVNCTWQRLSLLGACRLVISLLRMQGAVYRARVFLCDLVSHHTVCDLEIITTICKVWPALVPPPEAATGPIDKAISYIVGQAQEPLTSDFHEAIATLARQCFTTWQQARPAQQQLFDAKTALQLLSTFQVCLSTDSRTRFFVFLASCEERLKGTGEPFVLERSYAWHRAFVTCYRQCVRPDFVFGCFSLHRVWRGQSYTSLPRRCAHLC